MRYHQAHRRHELLKHDVELASVYLATAFEESTRPVGPEALAAAQKHVVQTQSTTASASE